MYSYDFANNKYYYHRYNIEVDPATGQATGGVVKEIVTNATFTGKADIEDIPPNIQNKQSILTFVNQNGIISEDTTTFVIQVPSSSLPPEPPSPPPSPLVPSSELPLPSS